MAHIIPFRGLRYSESQDLSAVTTPPYDVISPSEQDAFYARSEHSVIRLELGKEYPDDTPENNRYTRSAQTLDAWLAEKVLRFEEEPAIYLYEEIFTLPDGSCKSFKGFIPLVELEEFSKKIVLPHEETLSKAKADRLQLMRATHANFSQIYCLYMDPEKRLTKKIAEISARPADVSFVGGDGIRQNLWIVTDPQTIADIQAGFADKQLFIADGHHRYETALNFRNEMRKEHPDYTKDDLFNYVMMMLVEMDDPGLVVLPTHRMVKNLEHFDENELLRAVNGTFRAEKIRILADAAAEMERALDAHKEETAFAFYTGKDDFYLLTLTDPDAMKRRIAGKSEAWLGLDVSVLHTLILGEVFGIDMENMANQKNLVYTRYANEAAEGVKSGEYQCAFLLNATKVREIKDVSLANEKMPQKSTYFYPKLITGLVMNRF